MTEKRKSVLRSVRLDDDVWEAVKAMECSLNLYLRTVLLDGAGPEPGLVGSKGFQRGVAEVKERRKMLLADPDGPHDLIPPSGGLLGTITVDAEEKSATVNIETPKRAEEWKRGPRQKGDKTR